MKRYLLFCFLVLIAALQSRAQSILPDITVKNVGGKIIVSWRNEYALPVVTLNIQRSYDSLKNYSTIGSVLNPQNKENGYADINPPYNKMYYRVFIAFEGGSYIISRPVRPVKESAVTIQTASGKDSIITPVERYPWQVNPLLDSSIVLPPTGTPSKPAITYPSRRIFTARDNSVVIHLPDAPVKKYSAKFFDENDRAIFELNKLNEEYLIIEKVNFVRSGWYHFEIYESGELVEKNRFFVPKDARKIN
jgi:hypothetical protein